MEKRYTEHVWQPYRQATHCIDTGERAVEAIKEMDEQIIPWFQSAAAELLKDMPAEKALALALAKITGNTELKVSLPILVSLRTTWSSHLGDQLYRFLPLTMHSCCCILKWVLCIVGNLFAVYSSVLKT